MLFYMSLSKLDLNREIEIYLDAKNLNEILTLAEDPIVRGVTTNPSLLRLGGVKSYKDFLLSLQDAGLDIPVSVEVTSDNLNEIERQSYQLSEMSSNLVIKIPIINSQGVYLTSLINKLVKNSIKINITAVLSDAQIKNIRDEVDSDSFFYLSIFAGRIADTGINAKKTVSKYINNLIQFKNMKVIWASTREVYNIRDAIDSGCHIITLQNDIFKKLNLIEYDLDQLSIDTVNKFVSDALESKFTL